MRITVSRKKYFMQPSTFDRFKLLNPKKYEGILCKQLYTKQW